MDKISRAQAAEMIAEGLFMAIERSQTDFRTVMSLCDELDARPSTVRTALAQLEAQGRIRKPLIDDRKYDDWWRDTSRGLTKQERRIRLWAWLKHYRLRDIRYD